MRSQTYFFKILTALLIIVIYLFAQSNVIYDSFKISSSGNLNDNTDSPVQDVPDSKSEVQYVLIVCKDERLRDIGTHFDRHMDQLKVLFKSAAVLTSTVITFNIISNSEEVYNDVINITTDWPTKYSQRLIFPPMRKVYYPPGLEKLHMISKPCAGAVIFMVDFVEDLDAVIYIDTDTYFMQPPEDLWAKFKHFDHRQVFGLSPHARHYGRSGHFKKFPLYGPGVNTGMILMNLTRQRTYLKGWHESIRTILKKYRPSVLKGDQDIINIFLSGENGVYVYEIGCEWDYGLPTCSWNAYNICPEVASRGIALIHFKRDKIEGIFGAWIKFDLRSPVKELMVLMEDGIKQFPNQQLCISQWPNATDIILKGMMTRFTSVL